MYTSKNKGVAWIDNEYYDIPNKALVTGERNIEYIIFVVAVAVKYPGPLLFTLTSIPAWKSNRTSNIMWGWITYQFPNFSGCTVEV